MRLIRIATILSVAAACSSSDRASDSTAEVGGTLVIALPVEPTTLMPPQIRYAHEKQMVDQMFDGLAEIGPDLNTFGDAGWTPRLAQSWQWSADSLSISFQLNPGARWHDGKPVTAGDVKFSLDLYKDPRVMAKYAAAFADIDSVTTPDSLTAVAWYARRSPEQFYNLVNHLLPVPEHLLRDADRAALGEHPFAREPVGSGAFKFKRWQPRVLIEVVTDSTHFAGRAKLDRVIWTLHPDPTAALVKVIAGEADVIENLTSDGMDRLAGQEDVVAVRYTNPNYGYLGFNLRDPKNPERPHALFGDRDLRRAISMAIDRKAMLKNVFDTLGVLGVGPYSRQNAIADSTLRVVAFDSAGADRLLDSLGWRDANGDGVREKGGRALRFAILVPSSSVPRMRYAELIQAQLRPHGIAMEIETPDIATVGPRFYSGQFDAIINNFTADPSPSSMRESWGSKPVESRQSNFLLYGNAMADAAMDSALREPDAARSRALYLKAYQQVIDDVPAVWLYENRNFMAASSRLKPVLKGSQPWWRHLREWWIPAASRIPRDA